MNDLESILSAMLLTFLAFKTIALKSGGIQSTLLLIAFISAVGSAFILLSELWKTKKKEVNIKWSP